MLVFGSACGSAATPAMIIVIGRRIVEIFIVKNEIEVLRRNK